MRHACRTLVKQGHSATLEAFGLKEPEISLEGPIVETGSVEYGSSLTFGINLTSTTKAPQQLVLDYVVHFKKANGSLAPKVFKWTKIALEPGQTVNLRREHAIRPITTRVYYGGTQAVSLRINGKDFGYSEFELIIEAT